MNPLILAVVLFVAMYVLLLVFSEQRWIIALAAAVVFIMLGLMPARDALYAVDLNVLMMIAGTMLTVELFIRSRMPSLMAEKLLQAVPNVCWAVVALSLFAGLISAFVDNVATVLMVAPVGLLIAKKLDISPVPVVIAISVSSNLQGAATLVGDTTSILLGTYAKMSFNDFFWFRGRPGIAFAVEIGALLTIPVLLWLFRSHRAPVSGKVQTVVEDRVPTVLLFGMILLLIAASQFRNRPALTNGYICLGMGLLGILYEAVKTRSAKLPGEIIRSIDYKTLLLLTGLFMVLDGIRRAGVIDLVARLFVKAGAGSVGIMYVLIVGVSVLLSAFIDNIPYVATMLPVVGSIASAMRIDPNLFYFGLLIGATLGGNITPVGASANITGIGILQKEGYEVKTREFLRIGIPFTLVAAVSGAFFIWVVWS